MGCYTLQQEVCKFFFGEKERDRDREKRSRKTLDEGEVASCILLEFGGELMMIWF
jgi:hypothetical protein